jgi:isoleucyl-tRNA synthetase
MVGTLTSSRNFILKVVIGLIYRDYRPVHWSPSSGSALAEAELKYKEDHVSHSVYVSFAVDMKSDSMANVFRKILSGDDAVHLVVWTTTPWTLTANMVCCPNNTHLHCSHEVSGNCGQSRDDVCDTPAGRDW